VHAEKSASSHPLELRSSAVLRAGRATAAGRAAARWVTVPKVVIVPLLILINQHPDEPIVPACTSGPGNHLHTRLAWIRICIMLGDLTLLLELTHACQARIWLPGQPAQLRAWRCGSTWRRQVYQQVQHHVDCHAGCHHVDLGGWLMLAAVRGRSQRRALSVSRAALLHHTVGHGAPSATDVPPLPLLLPFPRILPQPLSQAVPGARNWRRKGLPQGGLCEWGRCGSDGGADGGAAVA
jgi:hypothetical protein